MSIFTPFLCQLLLPESIFFPLTCSQPTQILWRQLLIHVPFRVLVGFLCLGLRVVWVSVIARWWLPISRRLGHRPRRIEFRKIRGNYASENMYFWLVSHWRAGLHHDNIPFGVKTNDVKVPGPNWKDLWSHAAILHNKRIIIIIIIRSVGDVTENWHPEIQAKSWLLIGPSHLQGNKWPYHKAPLSQSHLVNHNGNSHKLMTMTWS